MQNLCKINQIIEFGDTLDRLNSLSLLVVLGERVLRERTQTYLGKLLGRALVTVKRSFDRFINERIESKTTWKKINLLKIIPFRY